MSWYGNTLYPTLDEVFYREAPPSTPELMSEVLRQHGATDVANYVARLDEVSYDDLKWRIELKQMERERPEDYEAACYEASYECK